VLEVWPTTRYFYVVLGPGERLKYRVYSEEHVVELREGG